MFRTCALCLGCEKNLFQQAGSIFHREGEDKTKKKAMPMTQGQYGGLRHPPDTARDIPCHWFSLIHNPVRS